MDQIVQLQFLQLLKKTIKNEGEFVYVALLCGYCIHEIDSIIEEYNQNYSDCGHYYLLWKYCVTKLLAMTEEERDILIDTIQQL